MIRFTVHHGASIAPAQPGLERLERDITYPIADGADFFHIDHGADYSRFFRGLGQAHFLLAREGPKVVGTLAAVRRPVLRAQHAMSVLYLADLKVAPTHRAGRLAPRMLLHALGLWLTQPELRTPWVYAAGMVGARGDFTRSARRPWNLMHLMQPMARLRVYFVPAHRLRKLNTAEAPSCAGVACLNLSPVASAAHTPRTVSTRGCKDLRLRSTGQPWPLVHVRHGPQHWGAGNAHTLRQAGHEATDPNQPVCFALDERLGDHIAWLESQGITTDTRCNVRALFARRMSEGCKFVHISTAEI